jgi:exodeoxyribonuclease V alpha subunit
VEIAKGYLKKYPDTWLHDFQIITALKQRGENSVKNLNQELQGIFNDLEQDYLERNGYQFRKNDKVIHSGNNYNALVVKDLVTYHKYKDIDADEIEELMDDNVDDFLPFVRSSVFNGTIGKIEYIDFDKKETLIQFEDVDGLVIYSQQQLNMIELAYAITIHRSQGMGIPNVLVTFDYVAFKLLSKQLVYTACTRASDKLVVICENGALHKAIETDNSSRNTFLKDLIMEGVK